MTIEVAVASTSGATPSEVLAALSTGALNLVVSAGDGADVVVLVAPRAQLEAVRGFCAMARRGVVVAATEPSRQADVRRALRLGAAGFVAAPNLAEALVPTVLAVAAGQNVVPGSLARGTLSSPLTTREKQILGMVVMGLGNYEIAARLHLAESTVKGHLSFAFRKLGVSSRNQAVARILDSREGFGSGILTIPHTGRLPGLADSQLVQPKEPLVGDYGGPMHFDPGVR